MGAWILLVALVASLAGVASWTWIVQKRHDSLSVIASAAAVGVSTLSPGLLAIHFIWRATLDPLVRLPYLAWNGLFLLSLLGGPVLLIAAGRLRTQQRLPRSVLLLQLCHLLLWVTLTLLGVALAFGA